MTFTRVTTVAFGLVCVLTAGCGAAQSPGSPSGPTGRLVIEFSPNPVRGGDQTTITLRETAGVGVTVTKFNRRWYDPSGTLTDSASFLPAQLTNGLCFTGSLHLAGGTSCSFAGGSQALPPQQMEYEYEVHDDNGHDLKFTSARWIFL